MVLSASYYNQNYIHNHMKVGDSDANLVHPGFLYFILCNVWLYHGRLGGLRHGARPSCHLSWCRIINSTANVEGPVCVLGRIGNLG